MPAFQDLTTAALDYSVLDSMPEGTFDDIAEAIETAADGAAPLVLLIDAMRHLGIDSETQDAILCTMADRAAQYLTGR